MLHRVRSFFVVFVARVIAIGLCADDMKIGEKLQSRSNYLTDNKEELEKKIENIVNLNTILRQTSK